MATVLLIVFGAGWALGEAPRAAEQRKSEMLAILAGEAAEARKAMTAIITRSRDNRFDSMPFEVRKLRVRYQPKPRPAELGQVFFPAERLEFVDQKPSAALDKYKSLIAGTLDPTERVMALRNIARLSFDAGSVARGVAALRDAVLIGNASAEERLLAFYELAEQDEDEGRKLVSAIEEGGFAGASPGRRAHVHEKLGGDRDRITALDAAEAVFTADRPDDLVSLPGQEVAWRIPATGDEIEMLAVPLDELLRSLLPGWSTDRWTISGEADVLLGEPFPTIGLGLGGASLTELDAHKRSVFWRRFSYAAIPALLLLTGSVFLLFSDLRTARLEKRKRDFLWSITHEFKTPIANILLYAETIHGLGGKDPERVSGFAQTIGSEAQRLLRMVQQALGVAAGKESAFLDEERFDLCALVEKVAKEYSPAAERKSIDLSVACPDAPMHLTGTRDFAERAVSGVLDNAIKFAEHSVKVAVYGDEHKITIDIEDDGPGVGLSEKERIFEPFVQLGDSTTRTASGTGLGLTFVRQCVENGGGRVTAGRSSAGGASFRIEYPRS